MDNEKKQNLVIVALLAVITTFTAFHEGYIPLISIPFLLSLLAGFSITVWLAMHISTKRLLSLIFTIFVIEYVKETIGIRSGLWSYHGIDGRYNFGVWALVLGGLIAYTLSTRIVIRQIKKLKLSPPRWLNQIILAILFLLILLLLGKYRAGAGALFYLFYALLFVTCIYTSIKMNFSVFIGIVITSWIVGNPSEFMGSAASGVWTFTFNPNYPPVFLLFGCWPLEILGIYSLSAYLANEPLDKDTF